MTTFTSQRVDGIVKRHLKRYKSTLVTKWQQLKNIITSQRVDGIKRHLKRYKSTLVTKWQQLKNTITSQRVDGIVKRHRKRYKS
jgi:hypothetical protein